MLFFGAAGGGQKAKGTQCEKSDSKDFRLGIIWGPRVGAHDAYILVESGLGVIAGMRD